MRFFHYTIFATLLTVFGFAGCAKHISLESCPDGSYCKGGMNCKETFTGSGIYTCTNAGCGNQVVEYAAGEECDLGTANSDAPGAACRTSCLRRDCGDGILDSGEECDNGTRDDGTGNEIIDLTTDPPTLATRPDACRGVVNPAFENLIDTPDEPRYFCRTAFCGDGAQDTGEECDDGNTIDDDECSNTCVIATCGDDNINVSVVGGAEPTMEQCDDGAANANAPDACRTTCRNPICGDNITDVTSGTGPSGGAEACDEGGLNSYEPNRCRPDCSQPFCGDNITDDNAPFNEACDDGVNENVPNICRPGCIAPRCGDSLIDDDPMWGEEACDDGDTDVGDGCNASCKVELGWSCTGQPSVCTEGCGDGLIRGSEECDNETDFIPNSGDGCSATCRVETGWTCTGEPSNCTPICGDNLRFGAEATATGCDDGNTNPNDGCNATCYVEAGWTCVGPPSVCTPICGDS
ncbi:MAG: hypothetical protein CVU59_11675, partial [Deltaproteobacteria bacterium HGW-Deltaproteobacteria-17]